MHPKDIYKRCLEEGNIIKKESIDIARIKSICCNAENELKIIKYLKGSKLDSNTHLFKSYYDVFRELLDAFALLNMVRASNHICLFSYIAANHPVLELDWQILDEIRRLRNRICYYGKSLSSDIYRRYEIFFELYIQNLIKVLKEKICCFG